MAHEIAKLLLEHARTRADRVEAVRTAMKMGMPLNEIEDYLDWVDAVIGPLNGVDSASPLDGESQDNSTAGETDDGDNSDG